MTTTETLVKIVDLFNQNLELLKTINEAFFSRKEHLTTVVDGTRYTIPSYIALENKVNHLQAAFNNLVHMPLTGEAYANFDGNSCVIQMRGYQQAPPSIDMTKQNLSDLNIFDVEHTDLFKDMLSPKPFLHIDLSSIDDDITQVVVKKIIPYNQNLISVIGSIAGYDTDATHIVDYSEIRAIIDSGDVYKKGVDYAEYDLVHDLPIRKMTCNGEYIVSKVLEDFVDANYQNIITVQLDESTPAVYTLFDGFTTQSLQVGDILTTYNGSARLQITNIKQAAHTLTLKVLSGEYVNLLENTIPVELGEISTSAGVKPRDYISDYSRLRFYKPADFDSDKYINVPLEEDPYVYIAVAPLNSRMNTQAPWNNGIFVATDRLVNADGVSFRDYYTENVKNIGDSINELAAVLPAPLTNLTSDVFESMLASKPSLTGSDDVVDTLQVVQINKHLNEAENIQTIRNLYSQKQQYKTDLKECEDKIAALTAELSQISFDDMSGSRTMVSAQITDLKARQNELIASINTAITSIANAANDTEVPIEDSKFRIRGYVDIDRFLKNNGLEAYADSVRAVKVRYRYKNPGVAELANVSTIGDFLFTEWNNYSAGPRHKVATYNNGTYSSHFDDPDKSVNDIKFNQVDIPITQGEQVDIQAKIVWDYGYPFVSIESDWSDAITIQFPQELAADVQITTILEENNSDIETYRFENILDNHGITQHSNDFIDDQNIRYFHKPESISSGFYTPERRIIPLSDKLAAMNAQLTSIQDMLLGTHAESLQVSLTVNHTEYVLKPDVKNIIHLSAYNAVPVVDNVEQQGDIVKMSGATAATTFGTITVKNVTDHTLRLFSMFPGARDLEFTKSRRFLHSNRSVSNLWAYAEPHPDSLVSVTDLIQGSVNNTNSGDTGDGGSGGPNNAPGRRLLRAVDTAAAADLWNDGGGGGGGGGGSTSSYVGIRVSPYSITFTPSARTQNITVNIKEAGKISSVQISKGHAGVEESILSNIERLDNIEQNTYTAGSTAIIKLKYNGSVNFAQGDIRVKVTFVPTNTAHANSGFNVASCTAMASGFVQEQPGGTQPSQSKAMFTIEPGFMDFGITTPEATETKVLTVSLSGFTRAMLRGYINWTNFESGGALSGTELGKLVLDVSGNYFDINPNNGEDGISVSVGDHPRYADDEEVPFEKEIVVSFNPSFSDSFQGAIDVKFVPNDSFKTWCETQANDLSQGGNNCFDFTGSTIVLYGRAIGGTNYTGDYTNTRYVLSMGDYDYTGGRMVYVADPSKINNNIDTECAELDDEGNPTGKILYDKVLRTQVQNQFITFRINEPYGDTRMGDTRIVTTAGTGEDNVKGYDLLSDQYKLLSKIARLTEFNDAFVYATPAATNMTDICLESDAVQSVMELGPGEVRSIPIFIAYFAKPNQTDCAYTLGFDIRNSLYNDPLFYQVTLAARYNQTYADMLNSQKASVANQTTYNPVIRS